MNTFATLTKETQTRLLVPLTTHNVQKETPKKTPIENVLIREVRLAVADVLHSTKVLESMKNNSVSIQNWQIFAQNRYTASHWFLSLLENGMWKSEDESYSELSKVFEENLCDEVGVGSDGTYNVLQEHETWRQDFYRVLQEQFKANGLTGEAELLTTTKNHTKIFEEIVARGSIWEMAGTLLFIERFIPQEFAYIQKGRDFAFTKSFVISDQDSSEVEIKKTRACHYIDDHIRHDVAHFKDALQGIVDSLEESENVESNVEMVQMGIHEAARAKKIFYKGFDIAIQSTPK